MGSVTTVGKCYLCSSTFSKSSMTKHLQACQRANQGPEQGKGRGRVKRLFHLVVEGRGLPQYWLHVEVPASATLAELDDFLRDTWVECCGHLSAFTIGGVHYLDDPAYADEKTMRASLGKVLDVGTVFDYEYDFGSTTELRLRVLGEREGAARGRSIEVLARNDAPTIACDECGKPATQICSQCSWEGKGWLCDSCAAEHECGDEMLLPVVNSPRVGVCGYTGETL